MPPDDIFPGESAENRTDWVYCGYWHRLRGLRPGILLQTVYRYREAWTLVMNG